MLRAQRQSAPSAPNRLTQLPVELLLQVYEHLSRDALLKLCRVNSLLRRLALRALLAWHGIDDRTIRSGKLEKFNSGSLLILPFAYPTAIPKIEVLDVDFGILTGSAFRALARLASLNPLIPRVSFRFSLDSPGDIIWKILVNLAGIPYNRPRPIILLHDSSFLRVHPWYPAAFRRFPLVISKLERRRLSRELFSTLRAAYLTRWLGGVDLYTFGNPSGPLSACIVPNPDLEKSLHINARVVSHDEWATMLEPMVLPSLRTVSVDLNFKKHEPLATFLTRHDNIVQLEFMLGWSGLLPPADVSRPIIFFAHLRYFSADPCTLALLLHPAHAFPSLEHVYVVVARHPAPISLHQEQFQAAIRGMALHPTVTTLTIQIPSFHTVGTPWSAANTAREARAERKLQHVRDLELHLPEVTHATRRALEDVALPPWLALFPALKRVLVTRIVPPLAARIKKLGIEPLLSSRTFSAMRAACPRVDVQEGQRNPSSKGFGCFDAPVFMR